MNSDYRKIDVTIRGLTPLLMNRLHPDSLKSKSRRRMDEYDTTKEAEKSAYMAEIDGKKQLYIPQEALYSMIINTAKQYTYRSSGLGNPCCSRWYSGTRWCSGLRRIIWNYDGVHQIHNNWLKKVRYA